jgi:hypothetical protein
MTAILTAEDVVRRIAAECAYVDERESVGIRLERAATNRAAVRRAIPAAAAAAPACRRNPSPLWMVNGSRVFLRLQ